MNNADRFGRYAKNFRSDLCHGGIRTLTHVYSAAANAAAAVSVDVHHRNGGRRRHARLDANRDTAAAANRSRTTIEWAVPLHALGQAVQNRVDIDVGHQHSGGVRSAFAEYVPAPKLERVHLQRPCNDVGLRLVRPDYLRDTEPAQCSGGRLIRVDRMAFECDMLDFVRTRGSKPRLLGEPRTDIRIRASVPPCFCFASYDAAVFVDACLEPDCRSVLRDGIELFFHREGNANGFSNQKSASRNQCLQLDV